MARQNTLRRRGYKTPEDKEMWEHPDATTNYEEGLAFKMDPETELYTRVASCLFGEPKFYQEVSESGKILAQNQDDLLIALARRLAMENPEFVLQLAAYARNELYLRTIPVILWTELATVRKKMDNRIVRLYGPSILKRADEPGEAIAYYLARNGSFLGGGGRYPALARKGVVLSHSMQKGIEDAIFANYDRYQIAKYDRKNAAVKWRDVINLVHPRSIATFEVEADGKFKEKQIGERSFTLYELVEWSKTFKDVLAGTLEPANTWEDTLMTWKQKGFDSKRLAWESIIPQMGYMALLRNLRNFAKEHIGHEAIEQVITKLKDPEEIKRSKQFPYRFYSAYKALEESELKESPGENSSKLMAALEDAMDVSVKYNLPRWPGLTYFAADFSGSMEGTVSGNSQMERKDVACLMMCMSQALCEMSICSVFADVHKIVKIHERDGLLSNVQRILKTDVGGSTDAHLSVSYLLTNKIKVDRFVLFSDLQCYNSKDKNVIAPNDETAYPVEQIAPLWNRYKKYVNPEAYLYSIDLAGYGTSQLPMGTDRLCLLAGFSDRILQFVPIFESEKSGAIAKIKSVTPETYKRKELRKTQEQQEEVSDDI